MTLKDRLAAEMREALKARQTVRLSALRMLAASVKNREVELGHVLSDEELHEVAAREVKRRKEAVEAYAAAGREDRADVEREEQRVLETYLPTPLTEQEVDALVAEAVTSTGATGPGDLGKVMGYVMTRAKGKVDGKAVQARVRALLGE
jgi:uncharacterized protein YqeY